MIELCVLITLANQEQYQDALEYFQQSLSIREKILKENHPDLSISYANIGQVYSSINQPDLTFEYYQKALKGFSDNRTYIFKTIVYQNIAKIFYNKYQLNVALNYYQQAFDIFRKSRPVNHPNVIYLEEMINQLTQTQ